MSNTVVVAVLSSAALDCVVLHQQCMHLLVQIYCYCYVCTHQVNGKVIANLKSGKSVKVCPYACINYYLQLHTLYT
jgi:hypothetical protein